MKGKLVEIMLSPLRGNGFELELNALKADNMKAGVHRS